MLRHISHVATLSEYIERYSVYMARIMARRYNYFSLVNLSDFIDKFKNPYINYAI